MSNPGRRFFIWLILGLLGGLLIVTSFKLGLTGVGGVVPAAFGFVGLILLPLGIVYVFWSLAILAGRARLRGGHRRLAQWHVSEEEWRRFAAFDPLRAGSGYGLANDFKPAKVDASGGIDVAIGETGVAIGDYYQVLRRHGLPGLRAIYWLPAPADPQCLEFHVVYPRKGGPGTTLCVRLPIAAGAEGEAQRAYDYFEPLLRPRPSLALRHPGRTITIGLTVALICAAITAWAVAHIDDGITPDNLVMIALVVAGPLCVGGLAAALITAIMVRRAR